jgi:magnesium-transporting ATPase (P-type)
MVKEFTMQTPGWIIIGAAFLLFVCVFASVAMAAVGGDAVRTALADDQASAASTQRSTNVCVGLFNLGACRTEQTSTTTSTKAAPSPLSPSPSEIILVLSVSIVAMVGAIVLFLFRDL